MKTRAAVLRKAGTPWEITELELDPPKANEVLIQMEAAGLCHSDEHIRSRGVARLPLVGGHEGAGVVMETGPGVTRVKVGDRVSCSYIPVCGKCRYCSTGKQNLCDAGKWAGVGCLQDETFRFHQNGEDFGGMCVVGSFAEYSVLSEWSCVKIEDYVPMELAALVSCGVTTGFCSAVYAGDVRVGDVVAVFGTGGVGMNAVQGAAWAGAKHVFAIDPNEWKQQQALQFGATHAFSSPGEAQAAVVEMTRGQGADEALVTVGVVDEDVISAAFDVIGKGGVVVVTGLANPAKLTVHVSGAVLTLFEKTIKGSLFGSGNPQRDILKMLDLYQAGTLKLDELVTSRYSLEQVNQGYADLVAGKNIRGVVVHGQ